MAAGPGFEPGLQGPEPCVLPLHHPARFNVGVAGLEPATSGPQRQRASQLRHTPPYFNYNNNLSAFN